MKGPVRSYVWSLAVIGALSAFLVGLVSRRQVDGLGLAPSPTPVVVDTYLASRQDGVEITETEYFAQLSAILEDLYVDGVKDKAALASGAVRGMVASLADPNSTFYNKEQMKALERRLEGIYDGVGAEFSLEFDANELEKLQKKAKDIDALLLIPILRVSAVMPGTPAEKAGIKEGDVVTEVEGRAVISSLDVQDLRKLQDQASKDATLRTKLIQAREEFRKKTENNMPAGRAREKLTTGTEGEVAISLRRGSEIVKVKVVRQESKISPVIKNSDGSYQIRFFRGVAEAFRQEGLDKRDASLDLRHSGQGDFGSLKALLEVSTTKGPYGILATQKPGEPKRLSVDTGTAKPPKYKLIVDSSTRSAAEVFALALSSRHQAQLEGGAMAGERSWIDTFAVNDGAGYTLTTGTYRPLTAEAKR